MKRREFSKYSLLLGIGALAGTKISCTNPSGIQENAYQEPSCKLPAKTCDVVVAGGGTAGVVAAIAAARTGAKTILIEAKGYPGGTVTEGGTALHSYYNIWKAFPGSEKRQVVKGIAQEIIDRLLLIGGTCGHAEMFAGADFDSVCTAIDTELYKLVAFEMLVEAGVTVYVNTLLTGAIREGSAVKGVITESRSGREVIYAKSFIDCTAYGDLAAYAGAEFTEPNDYDVCNSIGMGNVDITTLYDYFNNQEDIYQLSHGTRGGKDDQIVRVQGRMVNVPQEFIDGASEIGMSMVTTTVHDNYLMFIKFNMKLPESPTDRDTVAKAELELRQRQFKGVELFKKFIPGCEKSFIARTSPSLNIRRGRCITCDYDITHEDVTEARHFDDEVFVYGFHDWAPKYRVKDAGTYGIPYRALCVKGIENLFVSGMMITSDRRSHMSTRNTVSCFGQGQATGTAAALCAQKEYGSRDLPFTGLRTKLEQDGVYFES
ncbi:MAG: FAD-dependent oxidoreductase [Bacteroidales bacterium]|nr:FAD-dependent oxidoreductase [Bacteroidales bacterium]